MKNIKQLTFNHMDDLERSNNYYFITITRSFIAVYYFVKCAVIVLIFACFASSGDERGTFLSNDVGACFLLTLNYRTLLRRSA